MFQDSESNKCNNSDDNCFNSNNSHSLINPPDNDEEESMVE